jgi:hypothetical protein
MCEGSSLDRIAREFSMTPAEAVVLMTVGYEIPLPREKFIPHAAWEGLNEFTEFQVSEAYDNCLNKGWIFETVQGRPEFTEQGEKLWPDVLRAVRKWGEEWRAGQRNNDSWH